MRGHGVLIREEQPPPIPVQKQYIFEDVVAKVSVLLDGKVLKDIETNWDFSGRESSVEVAIVSAKKYALAHNIDASHALEIVVYRIASQHRKEKSICENLYAREFPNYHYSGKGRFGLPNDITTVVWTSRNTETEG